MHRRARFTWRGNTGCIGTRPAIRSLTLAPPRARHRLPRHTLNIRWNPLLAPPPAPPKKPASQPVESLLDGFCPEPCSDEQLAVHLNSQVLFVSVSDIEWLGAADTGAKLRVGKHTHQIRDTFAAVAAKLPQPRFVQISRTTLVNVDHVLCLQRLLFGEHEVILHSGKRLPLARGYPLPAAPASLGLHGCARLERTR